MGEPFGIIVQILAIIAAVFGLVAGIVGFFNFDSFVSVIMNAFVIVFSLTLLSVELYVFSWIKYFGFLIKAWGKAAVYLFMGALLFAPKGFGLACAIIFWILFVIYVIFAIILQAAAPPLFQRSDLPNISSSSNDYYNDNSSTTIIITESA